MIDASSTGPAASQESGATNIFALAEKRLAWIDQRQSVLAQNIANANTPGYQGRDIKPFSEVLADQQRQASSGGTVGLSTNAKAPLDRDTASRTIDGNAVTLDEQMEKVAETDTAHQLTLNLYKSYLSMFKTAIGHG